MPQNSVVNNDCWLKGDGRQGAVILKGSLLFGEGVKHSPTYNRCTVMWRVPQNGTGKLLVLRWQGYGLGIPPPSKCHPPP